MLEAYLSQLQECRNTTEALERLLAEAAGRGLPVSSLRYYRLRRIGKTQYLASADCAGHDRRVSTSLILGQVVKIKREPGEPHTDGSFDVIEDPHARPVVFQLERDLDESVRCIETGPPPFWMLRSDGEVCLKILGPAETRPPWVDVPLRMAGRTLGKLSCSLSIGRIARGGRLPPDLLSKLRELQWLATVATPFLESLRALDINGPLEQAGREIFTKRDYEALYHYCTHDLITVSPFDYEAADILINSRDTLRAGRRPNDDELLILRGSSYRVAIDNGWVNKEHYYKGPMAREWLGDKAGDSGKGLTPWVWRTGQPLRLSHDPDDPRFEKQLCAYQAGPDELSWAQRIPTTATPPHSLLIVPIFRPESIKDGEPPPEQKKTREVLGVIRFVNKRDRTAIDLREEVLLSRIADRCIGPKLLSLNHEIASRKLSRQLDRVNIFRLDPSPPAGSADAEPGFPRVLAESIRAFFPHRRKAVYLNLLRGVMPGPMGPKASGFYPVKIWNDLGDDEAYDREFELEGTLTDYVLKANEPYVFINDLEYAASQGCYRRMGAGPVCALASPVRFERTDYGALVILSDRFDITPLMYGKLVHVLASQIGLLLARRDTLDFACCSKGLRHDVPDVLGTVQVGLGRTDELTGAGDRERYRNAFAFCGSAIRAHTLTRPPDPKGLFLESRTPLRVERRVRQAAEQAWLVTRAGQRFRGQVEDGAGYEDYLTIEMEDGLLASVSESFLVVCLFNLLKNAWAHTADGPRIALSARLEGQDLVVRITNRILNDVDRRLRKIRDALGMGLPPALSTIWYPPETEGIGLRLVRRLADWHRMPHRGSPTGFRNGSLTIADAPAGDAKGGTFLTFVLQLPCCGLEGIAS